MKIFLLYFFIISFLNAITEDQYDELFVNLSNQGIIIGQDISTEDLYSLVENGEIYLKNGELNKVEFNKKVKELISFKEKQYNDIHEKLEKNPQSKTHKEIKEYFNDNNKRIEDAQKDFSKSDDDGWFSKTVNYILELMKY
jgi:hypothetical protein